MNTLLLILFKIIILYLIIYGFFLIFYFIRQYRGYISPKWQLLVRFINILKIKYNQSLRTYFLKIQKYKLNNINPFISFVSKSKAGKGAMNKNNITKKILNVLSYALIIIIFYFFIWDLLIYDITQIFIFSIISFAISIFISDKFNLNNNRFIKILQKLVFTNIILALFSFIGYLLDVSIFNILFCENGDDSEIETPNSPSSSTEVQASQNNTEKDVIHITSNMGDKDEEYYNFKIKKDIIADVWEKGTNLVAASATDIAPNIGIGAAVGKVGSEVIKQTAGMAPGQRLALVGSSALVTAVGAKVGLGLGQYLTANKIQEWENKLNTGDRSNSPTNFDGGFIHSFLDANEIVIPLVGMVTGLCYLNYIELILILNLFSLLFRKYLISKFIEFILSLNLKIIKNNNKILSFKNSMNSVDKYANFVIGFIFVCLFFIKIMNLYFSSHLVADIDSFVNVYNHIKKQ